MDASRIQALNEVLAMLIKEEKFLYDSIKYLQSTSAIDRRMAQLNQTTEIKNKIQQMKEKKT